MGTPNREPQEHSRNILGRYGSFPEQGYPNIDINKCYNPYSGDPQKARPHFGKPPFGMTDLGPGGYIGLYWAYIGIRDKKNGSYYIIGGYLLRLQSP